MTRPDQLRRFLQNFGLLFPHEPAWQLLRLAALFVKAHREPEGFHLEEYVERSPFFALRRSRGN